MLSVMSTKHSKTGISQVNFELEEVQRSVVIVLGRPKRRMVRIQRASMPYASVKAKKPLLRYFPVHSRSRVLQLNSAMPLGLWRAGQPIVAIPRYRAKEYQAIGY